ncbi:MAG: hypothetical protein AUJ85_10120 [Elusimicrobia bacterium CG1_02_37_114]|nr:MAG: hypothetical protein AUJ85_10120 [Elusimicrobia bacterium CG1_02_37_114]PIV52358.1 MAG: hypothetical protein COS17_09595 [Elusimicrobia bacterium CG02_land_8_20_14_3_00_37_13]PIZ13502.1 MAG: hypothetical protein COY53_04470 [Elusimicrobia bacterium CG_4_10_14_0_8_um_filter_37_32]
MKKDPKVFIEHILECINLIKDYTKDTEKEKFLVSKQLQDAVIRRIEIIGEAVKNVPQAIKDKNTSIPWKRIASMRDILVHEYFGVDIELTWKVVKTELAELEKQILKIRNNAPVNK